VRDLYEKHLEYIFYIKEKNILNQYIQNFHIKYN